MKIFSVCLSIGFFFAIPSTSAAAPIAVNETFSCKTQDECRRKCKDAGGRWKKDKTGTTLGTCNKPAARIRRDDLRVFDQSEVMSALQSDQLYSEDSSNTRLLGFVRAKGDFVEITSDCENWSRVSTNTIATMQETLVGKETCAGELLPFVRLDLNTADAFDGESTISYRIKKLGAQRFSIPTIDGGGLFVSDTILAHCADTWLDCQIDECSGQGKSCLDACEYEYDFCVADR